MGHQLYSTRASGLHNPQGYRITWSCLESGFGFDARANKRMLRPPGCDQQNTKRILAMNDPVK
eukprot:scaffold239255_cov19-Tisochrysis_lutea.AAC.2